MTQCKVYMIMKGEPRPMTPAQGDAFLAIAMTFMTIAVVVLRG